MVLDTMLSPRTFTDAAHGAATARGADATSRRSSIPWLTKPRHSPRHDSRQYLHDGTLFTSLLGMHSFLTTGEDEVRAWPIPIGTTAVQAAGKIHSDLERGFIRAEVTSFSDYQTNEGSAASLRQGGLTRTEGKDYVVKDGDILNILFNI